MDHSLHARRALVASALAVALAACGPGENDTGPGGVTVGEAQALDDAAAMLEDETLPADAIGPNASDTATSATGDVAEREGTPSTAEQ